MSILLFSIFNRDLIFHGNCVAERMVMDCPVELRSLRGLITGVILTVPFFLRATCVRSVGQFAYVFFLLL